MKIYIKILVATLSLLIIFFFANVIYNLFINTNCSHFEDKVLKVVEKQNYIDFKDIVQKIWDRMYILDLSEDVVTYSDMYGIDFSPINLPFRNRSHYQLLIFYKDDKMIKYGYLAKDRVIMQINSGEDRIVERDNTKFYVSTENDYTYILYK